MKQYSRKRYESDEEARPFRALQLTSETVVEVEEFTGGKAGDEAVVVDVNGSPVSVGVLGIRLPRFKPSDFNGLLLEGSWVREDEEYGYVILNDKSFRYLYKEVEEEEDAG